MSTRWMAVQFVGDTLRLPVANESDMGKPFGSSTLERDVRRIVVNPFSDSPQAFVPEAENAKLREEQREYQATIDSLVDECADHKTENSKLRELLRAVYNCTNAGPSCLECRVVAGGCTLLSAMRELGVEV